MRAKVQEAAGGDSTVERAHLSADTAAMAKKLKPPQPTSWNVYKFTSKAVWLGIVEASDEVAAMEKAAAGVQGAG